MSDHKGSRWWAYLRADDEIVVKRYHARHDRIAIREAEDDDLISAILGPFYANDRQAALKHVQPYLNKDHWKGKS